MPTLTPCTPQVESSDFEPVNGNMPPTTRLALFDDFATAGAALRAATASEATAAPAATSAALRRLVCVVFGKWFGAAPALAGGGCVRAAQEDRREVELRDVGGAAVHVVAAGDEDVDEIGVLEGPLDVLLDDHHGGVERGDPRDLVPHHVRVGGGEAGGRLVEHDHRGLCHQRP